jgi:hypothetical protein
MPIITLRTQAGTSSAQDLDVEVQDNTLEYLRITSSPTVRVSAYLDRDWPEVLASYAEIDIGEPCRFESRIAGITPGSKTRKGIRLPGPMKKGEQLVIEVKRSRAP